MFPGPIAFMWFKSILWKILAIFTHHTVSNHLCNNRSNWNMRINSISTNFVEDFYSFLCSKNSFSQFSFSNFLEIIWNIFFSKIKYIVITSININFYTIFVSSKLYQRKNDILHTLSVRLTNSCTIYQVRVSISKRILASEFILHLFDLVIKFLSYFWCYFFWVIQSYERIEKKRSMGNIRHPSSHNNRTCPRSTTCFINTDNILFSHSLTIISKVCFFQSFSYTFCALIWYPREVHALRKEWGKSGHHPKWEELTALATSYIQRAKYGKYHRDNTIPQGRKVKSPTHSGIPQGMWQTLFDAKGMVLSMIIAFGQAMMSIPCSRLRATEVLDRCVQWYRIRLIISGTLGSICVSHSPRRGESDVPVL